MNLQSIINSETNWSISAAIALLLGAIIIDSIDQLRLFTYWHSDAKLRLICCTYDKRKAGIFLLIKGLMLLASVLVIPIVIVQTFTGLVTLFDGGLRGHESEVISVIFAIIIYAVGSIVYIYTMDHMLTGSHVLTVLAIGLLDTIILLLKGLFDGLKTGAQQSGQNFEELSKEFRYGRHRAAQLESGPLITCISSSKQPLDQPIQPDQKVAN